MNIFYLDPCPRFAAQDHCDKHVVKMVLETAQLLSTAAHSLGGSTPELYRPTHVNHPCAVWVRAARGNFLWTLQLLGSLLDEYTFRYSREHATTRLLEPLRACSEVLQFPAEDCTPPAQAMPDEYKVAGDPVAAYRSYYRTEKAPLLQYTRRMPPVWL